MIATGRNTAAPNPEEAPYLRPLFFDGHALSALFFTIIEDRSRLEDHLKSTGWSGRIENLGGNLWRVSRA